MEVLARLEECRVEELRTDSVAQCWSVRRGKWVGGRSSALRACTHLLQLGRLERVDAVVACKETNHERHCQGDGRR